ncbi:MAG: type VI secretion system baseplate subunit TssF [Leptothrix sp. (in: Bacteria)]|nr:type VI secretion system baseplate subunit TssF [Leptothrix sp. (in: b-proteobacteria)]
MENLLPHYERELALLRQSSMSFAERYPKIAGRLQLANDVSQDPHVERMIESFALLAARVHKRLDDDFPLFTESMLEVLYPHYLRPFPSCSIAQFDLGMAAGQMSKTAEVARGTVLTSRPVKGVPCRFRTTQSVTLQPVRIATATFRNSVLAPEGTRLPAGATSVLSITLELLSPQASWSVLADQPLRVYLDGESSQVSALREALCQKVVGVMTQVTQHQPWLSAASIGIDKAEPQLAGFADNEALIDFDARSHAAYRLLTEYFAFPDKFNFVDLTVPVPRNLRQAPSDGGDGDARCVRSLTLHLLMSGIRSDSDESRLLETIQARSFVLGCTPVVNLFSQPADPIRVTHTASSYPVLPDSRRAFGHEVYSIDRVYRVLQTPHGESVDEFRPFFSLRHDDLLPFDEAELSTSAPNLAALRRQRSKAQGEGRAPGRYWHARRDDDLAEQSPGYETEISIVDVDFEPALPQTETLSLTVTATNRDLPSLLAFGSPGGDLTLEGGSLAREIRMLRKPTVSQRFERGRGTLWRLISHLSLNHLSLSSGGIDALKEMLRLYDLPRSASNRRQVDGLVAVEFRPTTAWLPGEPFATFVRGTQVRLTVDEDSFVGTGLGLLAAVMDHFFGLYVHVNSFTQLTIVSARTQEEVLTCPPRNGDKPLV